MSRHSVCIVEPEHDVLYTGSCTCGWKVGYDPSSYEQALSLAEEHCVAEFEGELAGPERA